MIRFGSLELSEERPVTIASGPLTDKFSKIKAQAAAGAGAVSLKLTFVRVPFQSQMRSYSLADDVIISPTNKRLDIDEAAKLARRVSQELDVAAFANYSALGGRLDEWKMLSERFQEAGVDALELNFCCPNLDTSGVQAGKHADHGGASICENPEASTAIVRAVKSVSDLPLIIKVISADLPRLLETALACQQEGIDGVHVIGVPISGLPPLDDRGRPLIPLLEGTPQGSTNGSLCRYNTYLVTANMAKVVDVPIMASGGLDTWRHCVDAIWWGASAPSVCSSLMWYGVRRLDEINVGIGNYMKRMGFTSFDEFRGKALTHFITPDRAKLVEGHARVIEERCVGCGRCARPAHCEAIRLDRERGVAVITPEECIACGVCQSLCPNDAIAYETAGRELVASPES